MQKTRHSVVDVGGGDKTFHRYFATSAACRPKIAKVARWGRRSPVGAPLRQLRHGFKVVANLRQQAADINRISRVAQRRFQFFVIKCLFSPAHGEASKSRDVHGFPMLPPSVQGSFSATD